MRRAFLTPRTADASIDWGRLRLGATKGPPPPTVEDLQTLIGVGTFSAREQRTVDELERLGIPVTHIATRATSSPDGYVAPADATVEIKRPRSPDKIVRRVQEATRQSRRLVLDLRELDIDRTQARNEVRRGLESVGRGYDEILVLGRGFRLLWP